MQERRDELFLVLMVCKGHAWHCCTKPVPKYPALQAQSTELTVLPEPQAFVVVASIGSQTEQLEQVERPVDGA